MRPIKPDSSVDLRAKPFHVVEELRPEAGLGRIIDVLIAGCAGMGRNKIFGFAKSVMPFGIATPNQFGTTLSLIWNSIVVMCTLAPRNPSSPAGATVFGSTMSRVHS